MTKRKSPSLLIFLLTVLFTSFACTVFVGGPDYSDRVPIPVSAEAAESLKEGIRKSFEAGLGTGVVTITINESQITSVIALRLQDDPNLQQDQRLFITDPQVYLRDGQMQIFGKTQQGMLTANIGIIVNMGVDANGRPAIEIASADFGPFPAPAGLKDIISVMIEEAYTGSVGPVATGLRIEAISVANGIMTITGRIK
jgi:hypothetical protein